MELGRYRRNFMGYAQMEMTQDEIIRMAREWLPKAYRDGDKDDARFTRHNMEVAFAAGAAHEREKQPEHWAKAIAELVECCRVLAEENEAAVLAEREVCAKVCDDKHDYMCSRAAAAIRARGDK